MNSYLNEYFVAENRNTTWEFGRSPHSKFLGKGEGVRVFNVELLSDPTEDLPRIGGQEGIERPLR
jgi:hypothetical protein